MVSAPVTAVTPRNEDAFLGSHRRLFLALAAIALIYAFLASLRTVSDPDLFWQLATGRWVAQHHHTFSTDVFSYTAQGQPWIYPVGSGLLFYAAYLMGGYALISWLAAVVCAGAVALLLRRGSAVSAAIAIVAVPVIASRSAARAELFTVLLFAAFLSLLWENHETGRAPLWMLPLLMIAWVNSHLGFVAGLALVVAFAGIESLELLFAGGRRQAARERLRRSSIWFAATIVASLVNPWGWAIYSAIARQGRATGTHSQQIAEWGRIPLNWLAASQAFALRSTTGTIYVLLVIGGIAVVAGLWQRRVGAAILLLGALYMGVQHVRMEALAACVVVVVGGALLASALGQVDARISNPRVRSNLAAAVVVLLAILVLVRVVDVVTNHRNQSFARFGTGLTWWVPQRAAEFVQREKLPGEIFNTYDEGGYILWKLGPERRDYIDGRAIPFGEESFRHQSELMLSPPDSEMWQREADRYNINTIVLSLVRFENWKGALKPFCRSTGWQPVYLDEVSAVIVRRRPETEELIKRLGVDCSSAAMPPGSLAPDGDELFNQWANAATVLAVVGRKTEALEATDKALAIRPDDSFLHWLRGLIYTSMGLPGDAEGEYLKTVELEPSAVMAWASLAAMYQQQSRIPETIHALRHFIDLSATPQPVELLKLAGLYLQSRQPREALKAFAEAERAAPPDMLAVTGARSFKYNVATGRSEAYRDLGDSKRAHEMDEEAVRDLVGQ